MLAASGTISGMAFAQSQDNISPKTASSASVTPASGKATSINPRTWGPRHSPIVQVVQKVRGSVVNIHSERPGSAADSSGKINGMGTGLVIDQRGYIVTNHHVIDEVNSLRVRLADGTSHGARVIARDPETDLALIKIEVPQALPVAPLGTSSDLMVGETVIAIGNAFGYEHTVTTGIVSAINRDVALNKDMSYKALIQTDASINPGNSGGPLLNVMGEVIGLNVAIRAGAQGIGFAIPADTLVRTTASMMASRRRHIQPGLVLREEHVAHQHEASCAKNLIVERVDSMGPAGKLGLRPGDVLLRSGEQSFTNLLDWERCLCEHIQNDKIPIQYQRQGSILQGELALAGPDNRLAPDELAWERIGLRLQPAQPDMVSRINPQLRGGLTILAVRPGSAANRAGLQRGDILIGLHQWEMVEPANLAFVLNHEDLASMNPVRFYVLRGSMLHKGLINLLDTP
jgi:serine protease Do